MKMIMKEKYKQNLDGIILLILGACSVVFAIWWNLAQPHITVKYDCGIAEISPDYPIQVKEACRKLSAK